MPSDKRTFITLAVDMPRHPKLTNLTKGQKWLIVEALMYSREFRTDGVIDMPTWRRMDTKRNREAVEGTDMCVVVTAESRKNLDGIASDFYALTGETLPTNCVYFPGYFDHQQSRAQIEEMQEKRRSAGEKGGRASGRTRSTQAARREASASSVVEQAGSKKEPEVEEEEERDTYSVGIPPVVPPAGGTTTNTRPELTVIDGQASPADEPAAKAPRQRATTGTRLPDDWMPPRDVIDAMRAECPAVDLEREHRRFGDYWRGVAGARGRKTDWSGTWRNWIRKADDDLARRPGNRPAGPTHPNGVPLTPAEIKAARAEALKDRPDPTILAAAGIPLTDSQRANLGMTGGPVVDGDGFVYDAIVPVPEREPSMFDQLLALEA